MKHFVLIYDTAPDYLQRRAEFRSAHLAVAWQSAGRGELLLGGAVGDPADSALLLFRCESADIPAAFAKADPYVVNGLVKSWQVKPWHTVVGEDAANPVQP
ncbi:YciI-like protein [Rheinheimera sp.]|uniref:YciI-like protein n=1 Tax=Rheinheimera sp. TaxID=1869214 RepID=UPI0027348FAD|nr:YciI-like protein [Rheinheimera sp.]MDP2715721.1 YciI-like protein [Rheinheimera sp.]